MQRPETSISSEGCHLPRSLNLLADSFPFLPDVDPTLKKALGEESGGKAVHDKQSSERKPGETATPKETKLPGKPVEKA